MKFKFLFLLAVLFLFCQFQVSALILNITPAGNLYGKDYYDIFGYKNINASTGMSTPILCLAGVCQTTFTSISINGTSYNFNFPLRNDSSLNVYLNETYINNTILILASRFNETSLILNVNTSIVRYTHLTNFTDNLGNRGYTSLRNFTNDDGYITNSSMNKSVNYANIIGVPSFITNNTMNKTVEYSNIQNVPLFVTNFTMDLRLSSHTNDVNFVTNNTMNRTVSYINIENYPVSCSDNYAKVFDNYTNGTAVCVDLTKWNDTNLILQINSSLWGNLSSAGNFNETSYNNTVIILASRYNETNLILIVNTSLVGNLTLKMNIADYGYLSNFTNNPGYITNNSMNKTVNFINIQNVLINNTQINTTNSGSTGNVLSKDTNGQFTWVATGGIGTVTEVNNGTYLTGGPITGTGTLDINLVNLIAVIGNASSVDLRLTEINLSLSENITSINNNLTAIWGNFSSTNIAIIANSTVLNPNITSLINNNTRQDDNLTALWSNITKINTNITSLWTNLSSTNFAIVSNISNLSSVLSVSIIANGTVLNTNITALMNNDTQIRTNITAIWSNISLINTNLTSVWNNFTIYATSSSVSMAMSANATVFNTAIVANGTVLNPNITSLINNISRIDTNLTSVWSNFSLYYLATNPNNYISSWGPETDPNWAADKPNYATTASLSAYTTNTALGTAMSGNMSVENTAITGNATAINIAVSTAMSANMSVQNTAISGNLTQANTNINNAITGNATVYNNAINGNASIKMNLSQEANLNVNQSTWCSRIVAPPAELDYANGYFMTYYNGSNSLGRISTYYTANGAFITAMSANVSALNLQTLGFNTTAQLSTLYVTPTILETSISGNVSMLNTAIIANGTVLNSNITALIGNDTQIRTNITALWSNITGINTNLTAVWGNFSSTNTAIVGNASTKVNLSSNWDMGNYNLTTNKLIVTTIAGGTITAISASFEYLAANVESFITVNSPMVVSGDLNATSIYDNGQRVLTKIAPVITNTTGGTVHANITIGKMIMCDNDTNFIMAYNQVVTC